MTVDEFLGHQCNCPGVDDLHRRFICMFTCNVDGNPAGYETFIRGITGDGELHKLIAASDEWRMSLIFHDIATYIMSPNLDLYSIAVKFFGPLTLDLIDPKTNETPLSRAIKKGNMCFVKFAASDDQRGRFDFSRILSGDNYLHVAAKYSNFDMIRLIHSIFKDFGLETMIDESNDNEKSPYDICIERKSKNTDEIFLPPAPSAGEVFNVIVVGSSQVGKSAFIKYLHEYNDTKPERVLEIGDGAKSCTRGAALYQFIHKYKEFFPLIGRNGKRIVKKMVTCDKPYEPKSSKLQMTKNWLQGNVSGTSGNVEFLYEQPNLDIYEVFYPKHSRNIRIIDTPGIGDTRGQSKGRDESHIMGVLDYLDQEEISTLHAVILLIKPDAASPEIQERILYYYKLFNIGIIYIVFTHYDKTAILKDFDAGINVHSKRIDYLEICGIRTPPYIFNVSVIPPSTLKESRRNYVTEFLTNCEINKLFATIIRSSRHIKVSELKFEKTKHMIQREKAIVDFINGRLIGLEDGIRQYDATAADKTSEFIKLSKRLSEKRDEIQKVKDDLKDKNNENLHLMKEEVYNEDWYWWWSRPVQEFEYKSKFPIEKDGIDVSAWKGVRAKVVSEQRYEIKIIVESRWFQRQDAVIKVFTKNKFFYEKEIDQLERKLCALNTDLVSIESDFTTADANKEKFKSLSDKERVRIRKFTDVAQFFSNKDISRPDYRLLMSFYHSSDAIDDSVVDKIFERRLRASSELNSIENDVGKHSSENNETRADSLGIS